MFPFAFRVADGANYGRRSRAGRCCGSKGNSLGLIGTAKGRFGSQTPTDEELETAEGEVKGPVSELNRSHCPSMEIGRPARLALVVGGRRRDGPRLIEAGTSRTPREGRRSRHELDTSMPGCNLPLAAHLGHHLLDSRNTGQRECTRLIMSGRVAARGTNQKHRGRYPEPCSPDLRRTCARLCHLASGELEQMQSLLGHPSVQTTERYLGCKQKLRHAVNDNLGLEDW